MKYLVFIMCFVFLLGCGSEGEKTEKFQKAIPNNSSLEKLKAGSFETHVLEEAGIEEEDDMLDVINKVMEQQGVKK